MYFLGYLLLRPSVSIKGYTFLGLDVSTVGSFIKDGGGEGLQGGLPVFQVQEQ
jgi:sulfate permease, SulP family